MAKLFLKNAHEFENPARRVFKEGGGELFGSAGGQAAKINAWVGGKESSPEARALAENVSKQAEEIREGARKELLELYVDIFTDTIPQKEVYNIAPLTVDATYAKNGLLQVLEKNSSDLRVVFQGTPDLRLLSYATVYQNFKVQGLDVNFLPIGAKVELVNGDVTVTYTENGVTKTATSEIFPWSTYETAHKKYLEVLAGERAEEARRIDETGGPQEDAALRAILDEPATVLPPEGTPVTTNVFTQVADQAGLEKASEVEDARDKALKEEWLTKVKPKLQALETTFPGVKITLTDASFDKKENKPSDEVDNYPNYGKHGKTVEIQYGPKKTDVKRYQIIVPKDAKSYFDSSVIINKDVEKGLGVTWKPMAHSETETVLDIFAVEADAAIKRDIEDAIVVADIARLNELTPAQQLYYLDWYVSRTLAMAQKDPRTLTKAEQKEVDEFYKGNVVMEVVEKWYLELDARPDLDPATRKRLDLTGGKVRVLQELRKAHPYEGMNKKEVAEYDMNSLFTDFDGSPESWQKVDVQYKKMREKFADGRISALDHYRGSEAAARAGRIDEAIALLDLAAKNAGDGTYEKADAIANQEALRKKYGTISLKEPTNRYLTYTPAPGAEGELYTAAALEYAKTGLQKNGRFEGRVPLGTYEVGGTKIYTVTAEGTTMQDKNAPAVPAEDLRSIEDIRSIMETLPPETELLFLEERVNKLTTKLDTTGIAHLRSIRSDAEKLNRWHADLTGKMPETSKPKLAEVKAKLDRLNGYLFPFKKLKGENPPGVPAEPTLVAPDREILRQNAQTAADALELSTRLNPDRIANEGQNYVIGAGVKVDQFLKQYVKGSFRYLTPTDRKWPEPNGDGSAEWSMDFRTAEGETFNVAAKTPALDLIKVRAFLEAQAAIGNNNYKEADLIKYLGLRAISEEFKKNIDSTRRELKLDEKYGTYLRNHILDTGPIESSLTVFPGLPNGDYVHISSLDLDDESPISGKRTLTCMDGVVFQGELKDNVPTGTGGLWLKNREMIGPMVFDAGKARISLPDGTTKDITWNRDSSSFEIRNI